MVPSERSASAQIRPNARTTHRRLSGSCSTGRKLMRRTSPPNTSQSYRLRRLSGRSHTVRNEWRERRPTIPRQTRLRSRSRGTHSSNTTGNSSVRRCATNCPTHGNIEIHSSSFPFRARRYDPTPASPPSAGRNSNPGCSDVVVVVDCDAVFSGFDAAVERVVDVCAVVDE